MRVALGSICKTFLKEFDIEIYSHVINIGGIESKTTYYTGVEIERLAEADKSNIQVIDEK